MDISGKTAIVTGAASGIGVSVATVLAEAGANVHGQTVNVAEQQSAELWPLLWPLEATLGALCILGASAIRGNGGKSRGGKIIRFPESDESDSLCYVLEHITQ